MRIISVELLSGIHAVDAEIIGGDNLHVSAESNGHLCDSPVPSAMALRLSDVVYRLHNTVPVDRIGTIALRRLRLGNVPCRPEAAFDGVLSWLQSGLDVELPAAESVGRLADFHSVQIDVGKRVGILDFEDNALLGQK